MTGKRRMASALSLKKGKRRTASAMSLKTAESCLICLKTGKNCLIRLSKTNALNIIGSECPLLIKMNTVGSSHSPIQMDTLDIVGSNCPLIKTNTLDTVGRNHPLI